MKITIPLRFFALLVAAGVFFSSAVSAQNQMVQTFPLNSYVRVLDGQWEGIRYASDGNVYFSSSSQSAHHGAAFFRYNPASQQLTMLAADITTLCGEDPATNPQGKSHSNMQEMHGWLFFTTHFGADDRPNGINGWTGSHLLGYRFTDTGANNYFNTPVGSFHDYGVIYPASPGYTSYSGIAVDPAQNYIYVFVTGEAGNQVSYVFRYNAATDTQSTRVRLGQVYGSFGSSLYWFVDSTGDVWFAIFNDNGALHRIHHDTQVIDKYDNVLPAFIRQDSNTIDSTGDRAVQWMAPIGGNKAVFTYNSGGMLYQFDASQTTSNSVPASAFTNLQWIGPSYVGSTVGNNRVFWYQRAGGAIGHQGCNTSDTVLPPACQDYHLKSVSLDSTTGYAITDHGLLLDQRGRTVWRTPSMMTDGTNDNVYLVGDWWTYDTAGNPIPGDDGVNNTLRYHYAGGVESYINEPRGEFFAVAHITGGPVGSVSVSPASAILSPGQTQQFTATIQSQSDQSVTWSLNPLLGSVSASGLYQAPMGTTSSQVVTLTATSATPPGMSASAKITLQPGATSTAQFIKTDSGSQGNWRGTYGGDGSNVLGDVQAYPAYTTVTPNGPSFWVWAQSTSDPRALQKSAGQDRVAATWYTASSYTLDVNISDGKPHQLALYSVDWDNRGRSQMFTLLDAQTGIALDSRTLSGFTNGTYLVWTISGHVLVQITRLAGINAVLSGVFFDTASSGPSQPVITQQPQSATVSVNQSASFSVIASGAGLTYQWQARASGGAGFVNIPGATAGTYTTAPATTSDNGTQYLCVVTNSAGSVASNPATLTVQAPGSSTPFVVSTTLGTPRNNYAGWVGMSITVNSSPLTITALGRIFAIGNQNSHAVKIVTAATGADVTGGSVSIPMSGGTPGAFVYANLPAPIVLNPNTTYHVISQESSGGDNWYDHNTTATATSVARITAAVYGTGAPYTQLSGSAGSMYVPVDFKYSPNAATTGVYVTSITLGTQRNNFTGWVGMAITVGSSPLTVTALGRLVATGNSRSHGVKLVSVTGADIAGGSVLVNTAGTMAGSFAYSALNSPVTLNANTTYYLVSQETSGDDSWYDHDTTVQGAAVATITSAVWSAASIYNIVSNSAGHAYGPVDFKFQ